MSGFFLEVTSMKFIDEVHFDYETRSEVDLTKEGVMRYVMHPSTRVMLVSWHFKSWGKGARPKLWDYTEGEPFPAELRAAIENRQIKKVGFNAAFERLVSKHVLGFDTGYRDWQCGMVLAFMLSFVGGLGDIGRAIGQKGDKAKDAEGKRLIRLFCMPQKITKKNPYKWRDELTDPEDWEKFRGYCVQDVIAEMDQWNKFIKYPVGDNEWDVYALDQQINDKGYPLDLAFIRNAIDMVGKRKEELKSELIEITGLRNPNSPVQLKEWLKEQGYPFNDLQKNTVKKALREEHACNISARGLDALRRRRWAASTAATKYTTYLAREYHGIYYHGLQMAGAQRTRRWSGRGAQPHNQARTPKDLENVKGMREDEPDFAKLEVANGIVQSGDYEMLKLFSKEPMEVLAQCVRSATRALPDHEFRVSDLASIESLGIAYLTNCQKMMDVFLNGKDIYRDFGTYLYHKGYDEITGSLRTNAKPAVLGAGFGLGGGDLDKDGERTGLWGYAESMGIDMSHEDAHESVRVFREDYAPEVASSWDEIDKAIRNIMRDGKPRTVRKLRFEYVRPFLVLWLPSGRPIYYYNPKVTPIPMVSKAGNPYTRYQFSYMGKNQVTGQWTRVTSWGGKVIENATQAFSRDVLVHKLIRLNDEGFDIRLHIHDEGVTMAKKTNRIHTLDRMNEIMRERVPFALELPLGSAGYVSDYYRKD